MANLTLVIVVALSVCFLLCFCLAVKHLANEAADDGDVDVPDFVGQASAQVASTLALSSSSVRSKAGIKLQDPETDANVVELAAETSWHHPLAAPRRLEKLMLPEVATADEDGHLGKDEVIPYYIPTMHQLSMLLQDGREEICEDAKTSTEL